MPDPEDMTNEADISQVDAGHQYVWTNGDHQADGTPNRNCVFTHTKRRSSDRIDSMRGGDLAGTAYSRHPVRATPHDRPNQLAHHAA